MVGKKDFFLEHAKARGIARAGVSHDGGRGFLMRTMVAPLQPVSHAHENLSEERKRRLGNRPRRSTSAGPWKHRARWIPRP